MSRHTPTSRRSPSILVTDVRHSKAHLAPFVSRRLNNVSIESLLSNTSEVPSAQRRVAPRRPNNAALSTSNYGRNSHRSRMAGGSRRPSESTPLLEQSQSSSPPTTNASHVSMGTGSSVRHEDAEDSAISSTSSHPGGSSPTQTNNLASRVKRRVSGSSGDNIKKPVKPVPQLSKSLPSRTSKQSQRLVLIPEADADASNATSGREHPSLRRNHSDNNEQDNTMRVTSYLISEGVLLHKAARYLKEQHRARVRLYDEALFADYLLPLLPGDGVEYRVMSSVGDNRTMERLIDISEQRDHHYEYFAASETAEQDPSEPQDFSPRPNVDSPLNARNGSSNSDVQDSESTDSSDEVSDMTVNKSSLYHEEPNTTPTPDLISYDEDALSPRSTEAPVHHPHTEHTGEPTASSSSPPKERHHNHSLDDYNYDEQKIRKEKEEEKNKWDMERKLESYTSHAEIFVFNYGVVVFWNFTEAQEKQILADLCIGGENLVIHQYSDQEIQSEELGFAYALGESEKPQIFNDLITLNSNSHMLKLAMSHAMAQSTILCGFEDRMQAHLKDVRGVPKSLALTGKLGLNREQLLKISGRLFKLRVDVNLSSNVLDIPEFFWDSEPSLFPLFNALREYLEIDERVLVLNERQSVFLELTSILGDSIAEFNMDRITIIVIWLIVLSICVSLTEIGVRFLILKKAGGE